MSESKVSTMYIALLLGALIITGFAMVQGDVFSNYSVDTTDLSYLNATDDVINQTANLKESIESTVITGIAPVDQFLASTFGTTQLFFGVIDIYSNFVADTALLLGIPVEFSILIIIINVIITITVIFVIIRAVTHESV